jgi:outer membrane receptor protein involved in Fe transport
MLKSMTIRSTLAAVACAISFLTYAVADPPKQLNIPAGALVPALELLEKQAAIELVFQPDQLKSFHTKGVSGSYEPKDAVRRLLKGMPLELRMDPTGAMVIVPVGFKASVSALGTSEAPGVSEKDNRSGERLQLAQVDQRQGSSASLVVGQVSTSEGNSASSSIGLQEIIVTAQKREERLQDVPISISVLGGKDLDQSTFDGATAALNTVPGMVAITNQTEGGGTYLTMRGVSSAGSVTTNGGASPVAYYVDSIPFGMVRTGVVPDENIYDLQQIEVLRGPQGTLYGANALVGVVRILTNDADLNNFDFKARTSLSTTEYGGENYDGDMAVNIPIVDGKLAARAVVGDDHESGWINGPLGEHLNYGELSNVRLKIDAQPTDQLSIGLSGWHSQSDLNFPGLSTDNREVTVTNPQPIYTQFNAFGARVNYDFPAFSVSSATSFIKYANSSTFDNSPYDALGCSCDFLDTAALDSRVFSEELNLTSKPQGPWRWSAGAMYRDDRDLNKIVEFSGRPYAPGTTNVSLADNFDDTSKSTAVYGEIGRRFFHDELQLTLGLRYFHDDEGTQANSPLPGLDVPLNLVPATSEATTPRAVLTWLPYKDLTAYASYSQGFRSGFPQDELVGAVVPDFSPLKPDKLTNYEVGVKGTLWDERVSYDTSIYYMQWRNIQQLELVLSQTVGYVPVMVNAGSASGQGIDSSLKARPLQGLEVGATLSWNNLHFDSTTYQAGSPFFNEGDRPNESPEWTAGASAQYSFPLGQSGFQGQVSATGNFISSVHTTNLSPGEPAQGIASNSVLITGGRFAIDFPEHWTVALFVDNANNWHGTTLPVAGVEQQDTRLRPRTYGLRLDYHLR